MGRFLPGQVQHTVAQRHVETRRVDENMAGVHHHAIAGFRHRNFADAGQYLRQQALVIRCQVLHQNEGHAGVRRNGWKQPGKSFQTAGRSPDSCHRELGLG